MAKREVYYCSDRGCYIVPLTMGYEAMIDEESVDLISGRNWHASVSNATVHNPIVYARSYINLRQVKMHRLIAGAKDGQVVDHLDGNGLNNRVSNLRVCSHSDNLNNSYRHRTGSVIGATPAKSKDGTLITGWKAQITYKGRTLYLGTFKTADEANAVFVKAREMARNGDNPLCCKK